MMPSFRSVLVFSIAFLLASCATTKKDDDAQAQASHEKPTLPLPIAPNTCRLIATVEAIEPIEKTTNENDPCSKAPCVATIKVDSVLGYGSAFPKPISAGAKFRVRFAHTLSATSKDFPDVKPSLPGLSVGSQFVAVVNGASAMKESEPALTIYGYEKK